MHQSVWENTKLPGFEELSGEKITDVLIIGGGMCGILCAYFLQKAGVDYILAEGGRIGCGITKDTTAKITAQHGLIYNKLIKQFGEEKAGLYLAVNLSALSEFIGMCGEIDCDFESKPAYVYSLSEREKIEDEVSAVNRLGFPAEFCTDTPLPFDIEGAVCFPDQAQFNPFKFISAVSKGLNIYENTFIREITPNTVILKNGKISAKKIIVATHFPFINKHGSYFIKLYQQRSYVSAFSGCPNLEGMYLEDNGMSFRNYNGLLFIGGNSHRTGKKGGGWEELRRFAKNYYPGSKEEYIWAAQDCMSLDGVPYIGKYSKNTPDLYVASGFNKWGMTSSMAAAKILTDMVLGKRNEFSKVFSPQRSVLKPQLFINAFEAVSNLITPAKRRCPHLGCALKWNPAEHTWDCPCHGSRFESDGELIDNPATGNAKV